MKRFLTLALLLTAPATALASPPPSYSLISGNALMTPETVQKIIKAVVVRNLEKNNLDVQSQFGGLSIQGEEAKYFLKIPQQPILRDILNTLGVADFLQIRIDPIHTSLNFGPDSLKVKIQKKGANLFRIHAHWQMDELIAESKGLHVMIPKGVFDQSFTVTSSPVKIGLKPGLGGITADLVLNVVLTDAGAKVSLESFDTNLSEEVSKLRIKLGVLTVNGTPLEVEVLSNSRKILTDEPTVRAQFQHFEPQLIAHIQKQLSTIIRKKFTDLSAKLDAEEPFKLTFQSTDMINKYSIDHEMITSLLDDMSAKLVCSYVQELPAQKLFTTQVTSQVCVGQVCLSDTFGTSNITTEDVHSVAIDGAGVILYESWVQNVVNSGPFQRRVREFYAKNIKTPGVALGKDGIKVHFNQEKNAIIAVLNLVIDIKATADPKGIWTSWSKFKTYTKKELADLWEAVAGSGSYVYLPVELTFNFAGIVNDETSKRVLLIRPEIPFYADGTIANTYGSKSNVEKMNKSIRAELLSSVKKQVGASLPPEIKIPLDKPIGVGAVFFDVHRVFITKNKGLLVSGSIQ